MIYIFGGLMFVTFLMSNDTGINGKKEQHDDNMYNCQCTAALVSVQPRWSKLKLAASQSRATSITFITLVFHKLARKGQNSRQRSFCEHIYNRCGCKKIWIWTCSIPNVLKKIINNTSVEIIPFQVVPHGIPSIEKKNIYIILYIYTQYII
jgi:hypothetical protein